MPNCQLTSQYPIWGFQLPVTVVPQAVDFTYILFTQEVSTRVTSGQHGLSDLNQWYFELKVSREPQGLRRSGLCCKIAECILFQTDQVWKLPDEILRFYQEENRTPSYRMVAMRSGKLLQTPSSHQVATFCVKLCLVDGWKASQLWYGLCLRFS